MLLSYRSAKSVDMDRCLQIRGMTRDNPMTIDELASIGVSSSNWCPLIESGEFLGVVCESKNAMVGFCFGEVESAEILVLAILPEYEGMGIGTKLLADVCKALLQLGLNTLWLAASPDPKIRAHGFYRSLGWTYSGNLDSQGDQIMALKTPTKIE